MSPKCNREEITSKEKLSEQWTDIWLQSSITQQIQIRDFWRGREFILHYLPYNGLSIEAGCGLGRYVYYLTNLGNDIIGVDISDPTIKNLKKWGSDHGHSTDIFKFGDVRNLQYPDNSFSGYISLGVVEHFEEGPHKALSEAYRILRGGGIAIVETPNKFALDIFFIKCIKKMNLKYLYVLSKIHGENHNVNSIQNDDFFQYEFSVEELAKMMQAVGFVVIDKRTIDLKYPIYRLINPLRKYYKIDLLPFFERIVFPVLDCLEKTPLRIFGGLSMVIGCKINEINYCFFCGKKNHDTFDDRYRVTVCQECSSLIDADILKNYAKGGHLHIRMGDYRIILPENSPFNECHYCKRPFHEDKLFGDYGFSVPICSDCLKDARRNIDFRNKYFRHEWRDYYKII